MKTKDLTSLAMFMSLGILVPYFFHLSGLDLGKKIMPMHLIISISFFYLGLKYSTILSYIIPLMNFILLGMPTYPLLLFIMIEIQIYMIILSLLNKKWKINIWILSISLFLAKLTTIGLVLLCSSYLKSFTFILLVFENNIYWIPINAFIAVTMIRIIQRRGGSIGKVL